MNYETDELSQQELKAFKNLHKAQTPPPALEERTIAQLKSAGLIGDQNSLSPWERVRVRDAVNFPKLAAGFALALGLLVIGVMAGARWNKNAAAPEAPGFILIVRTSNPEFEAKTAQEEMTRVKEYSAWARDLGKRGMLLGGEKLKDDGRVLSGTIDSSSISETPTKPIEGAVAGYFLLPATNYDQAVAIARTCPHLSHGGSVELRQIERF
jgi:hypothetical protein